MDFPSFLHICRQFHINAHFRQLSEKMTLYGGIHKRRGKSHGKPISIGAEAYLHPLGADKYAELPQIRRHFFRHIHTANIGKSHGDFPCGYPMGNIQTNVLQKQGHHTSQQVMLQSTEVIEPALDFFLRQFFGKAFFDGGNNRSEIIWILPEIIAHRNDREKVSGGERQRISIARALLKDAPIILLDEATASLDPENEVLIQRAIARLVEGKTVIMIAHRLRTVVDADQIFVLENGKLVERGTHDELIAHKGLYEKLYHIQQESLDWVV